MRREFSKTVRRDAFKRANGRCEGTLPNGERCNQKLGVGNVEYDHDTPDWMGGLPTLDNCVVLCKPCHKDKTHGRDRPMISKTRNIIEGNLKIKTPSKLSSKNRREKRTIDGRVIDRITGEQLWPK